MAVGRLTAGCRGRRAGCHRVAAVALLRYGGSLQPDWGENMTPRGHHHRGGLPCTLARRVGRLGSLLLRVVALVVRVVVLMVVIERVRLEGGGLLPLGAVVVRRVAGQIVALRVFLARGELRVHIVGVDQIGAHGH